MEVVSYLAFEVSFTVVRKNRSPEAKHYLVFLKVRISIKLRICIWACLPLIPQGLNGRTGACTETGVACPTLGNVDGVANASCSVRIKCNTADSAAVTFLRSSM